MGVLGWSCTVECPAVNFAQDLRVFWDLGLPKTAIVPDNLGWLDSVTVDRAEIQLKKMYFIW